MCSCAQQYQSGVIGRCKRAFPFRQTETVVYRRERDAWFNRLGAGGSRINCSGNCEDSHPILTCGERVATTSTDFQHTPPIMRRITWPPHLDAFQVGGRTSSPLSPGGRRRPTFGACRTATPTRRAAGSRPLGGELAKSGSSTSIVDLQIRPNFEIHPPHMPRATTSPEPLSACVTVHSSGRAQLACAWYTQPHST